MPTFICKLDGLYFEWSTVVDAPVSAGMTLDEFVAYYRDQYGARGLDGLDSRLARVEAAGTSSRMHPSVMDVLKGNRAGEEESEASREEIVAMLRESSCA